MKPIFSFPYLRPAPLVAALLLLSACADDSFSDPDQSSDRINYGISISNDWLVGTRAESAPASSYQAEHFQDSPLWLVSEDKPSIDSEVEMAANPLVESGTRSMPITNAELLASHHNSFGVYAYYTEDTSAEKSTFKVFAPGDEISGLTAPNAGALQKWLAGSDRFWPAQGYMQFHAFSPYSVKDIITASSTGMEFNYTVNENSQSQPDIVVAVPQDVDNKEFYECDNHDNVELTFRHLLTAVKVRAAKNFKANITSVKIKNIETQGSINSGDLKISTDDSGNKVDNNQWDLTHTVGEVAATVNKEVTGAPNKTEDGYEEESYKNSFIVNDGITFMMLPQELTDQTTLVVEYTDEAGTHEISAVIGGKNSKGEQRANWVMGHTVIYNVSLTEVIETGSVFDAYQSETKAKKINVSKDGATIYLDVESHAQSSDNTTADIPWVLDKSSSTGLDIFESLSNIQSGDGDKKNMALTVKKNEGGDWSGGFNIENMHNGNSADLSYPIPDILNVDQHIKGTEWNTANCYIISHQNGHYLPLIYGNGIRNGEINTQAFMDENGNYYQDFQGRNITTPFIQENYFNDLAENGKGGTKKFIFKAIWMDQSINNIGLVDAQSYTIDEGNYKDAAGNSHSVKRTQVGIQTNFINTGANVKQGNALFGLYLVDNNHQCNANCDHSKDLIWTWHIWFTRYRGNTVKDPTTGTDFMKYNLGYINNADNGPRHAVLVFKQEYEGKVTTKTVEVVQEGPSNLTDEDVINTQHAVFFQWGRMVPIMDSERLWTWTQGQGYGVTAKDPKTVDVSTLKSFTDAAHHPDAFITNKGNWLPGSGTYENWIRERLWREDVKTVYDPCPPGYMVPKKTAFPDGNSPDIEFTDGHNKETWYLVNRKLFFNQTGLLSNTNGKRVADQNNYAFHWTSTPSVGTDLAWYYYGAHVECTAASLRGLGVVIRPIREKGINPPATEGDISVNPWDNTDQEIKVY